MFGFFFSKVDVKGLNLAMKPITWAISGNGDFLPHIGNIEQFRNSSNILEILLTPLTEALFEWEILKFSQKPNWSSDLLNCIMVTIEIRSKTEHVQYFKQYWLALKSKQILTINRGGRLHTVNVYGKKNGNEHYVQHFHWCVCNSKITLSIHNVIGLNGSSTSAVIDRCDSSWRGGFSTMVYKNVKRVQYYWFYSVSIFVWKWLGSFSYWVFSLCILRFDFSCLILSN